MHIFEYYVSSCLVQEYFHVFFDCRVRLNVEFFNQHFKDGRRDTGRKSRAEGDILYTKAQESEQDKYGFLLVPGYIVGNGKIIYIFEAEGFCKLLGYYYKRVRIVTLSCIDNSWDSTNVTKAQFIVAVFGAACGQDYCIFGKSFCKFGVRGSFLVPAIAACHNHGPADLSSFHCVYNFISN